MAADDIVQATNATKPCQFACGPFVAMGSAYDTIYNLLMGQGAILALVYALATNPAVLWCAVFSLGITALFSRNSALMERGLRESREAKLTASLDGLHRKLKAQEKKLRVLQGSAGDK